MLSEDNEWKTQSIRYQKGELVFNKRKEQTLADIPSGEDMIFEPHITFKGLPDGEARVQLINIQAGLPQDIKLGTNLKDQPPALTFSSDADLNTVRSYFKTPSESVSEVKPALPDWQASPPPIRRAQTPFAAAPVTPAGEGPIPEWVNEMQEQHPPASITPAIQTSPVENSEGQVAPSGGRAGDVDVYEIDFYLGDRPSKLLLQRPIVISFRVNDEADRPMVAIVKASVTKWLKEELEEKELASVEASPRSITVTPRSNTTMQTVFDVCHNVVRTFQDGLKLNNLVKAHAQDAPEQTGKLPDTLHKNLLEALEEGGNDRDKQMEAIQNVLLEYNEEQKKKSLRGRTPPRGR